MSIVVFTRSGAEQVQAFMAADIDKERYEGLRDSHHCTYGEHEVIAVVPYNENDLSGSLANVFNTASEYGAKIKEREMLEDERD